MLKRGIPQISYGTHPRDWDKLGWLSAVAVHTQADFLSAASLEQYATDPEYSIPLSHIIITLSTPDQCSLLPSVRLEIKPKRYDIIENLTQTSTFTPKASHILLAMDDGLYLLSQKEHNNKVLKWKPISMIDKELYNKVIQCIRLESSMSDIGLGTPERPVPSEVRELCLQRFRNSMCDVALSAKPNTNAFGIQTKVQKCDVSTQLLIEQKNVAVDAVAKTTNRSMQAIKKMNTCSTGTDDLASGLNPANTSEEDRSHTPYRGTCMSQGDDLQIQNMLVSIQIKGKSTNNDTNIASVKMQKEFEASTNFEDFCISDEDVSTILRILKKGMKKSNNVHSAEEQAQGENIVGIDVPMEGFYKTGNREYYRNLGAIPKTLKNGKNQNWRKTDTLTIPAYSLMPMDTITDAVRTGTTEEELFPDTSDKLVIFSEDRRANTKITRCTYKLENSTAERACTNRSTYKLENSPAKRACTNRSTYKLENSPADIKASTNFNRSTYKHENFSADKKAGTNFNRSTYNLKNSSADQKAFMKINRSTYRLVNSADQKACMKSNKYSSLCSEVTPVAAFHETSMKRTFRLDRTIELKSYNRSTSPFKAAGYRIICDIPSSLDHINVPVVDKHQINLNIAGCGVKKLGSGVYGSVYMAEHVLRKDPVCVKDYNMEVSELHEVYMEAKVLLYLKSTSVVPECIGLMESSLNTNDLSLVQECYAGGFTLQKMLSDCPALFDDKRWVNLCYQLLVGLYRIHSLHVLINDIKWDNILVDVTGVDPNNCVRYIDFGLATFREGRRYPGDPDYMKEFIYLAPEVRNGMATTPASDVYSLGQVFDDIYSLTGIVAINEIATWCLKTDPEERPMTHELIERVRAICDSFN